MISNPTPKGLTVPYRFLSWLRSVYFFACALLFAAFLAGQYLAPPSRRSTWPPWLNTVWPYLLNGLLGLSVSMLFLAFLTSEHRYSLDRGGRASPLSPLLRAVVYGALVIAIAALLLVVVVLRHA